MERGLVWTSVLDGRYAVTVTRTGADEGMLRVQVIDSGRILHDEAVRLAYGALFGPERVGRGSLAGNRDRSRGPGWTRRSR